ncbi:hypothetical protein [Paraburkholderia kururiensis]|uniref:hypothetical protein n=2 Tax=Paraburkholderia TaxID=1822464 RepID=UPI003B7AF028
MSRILNHQADLYASNEDFMSIGGGGNSDAREREAERYRINAAKYLRLAMNSNYPPALTYFECRKYKIDRMSWQPSEEDVDILIRAASMGEARSKYLLAIYVHLFGIGEQHLHQDTAKAYKLLIEAYKGGDGEAANEIVNMGDPSVYPDEIVREHAGAENLKYKYFDDYRDSEPGNLYGIPVSARTKNPDPCSDAYRN